MFISPECFITISFYPHILLILNKTSAAHLSAPKTFCTALPVYGLAQWEMHSKSELAFVFVHTYCWVSSSLYCVHCKVWWPQHQWPQSYSGQPAELGNVPFLVIRSSHDIAKCHLFCDMKRLLGTYCRLSKQFQKTKELRQD